MRTLSARIFGSARNWPVTSMGSPVAPKSGSTPFMAPRVSSCMVGTRQADLLGTVRHQDTGAARLGDDGEPVSLRSVVADEGGQHVQHVLLVARADDAGLARDPGRNTASSRASEPVCEAAALAPAGLRPTLVMTSGLPRSSASDASAINAGPSASPSR